MFAKEDVDLPDPATHRSAPNEIVENFGIPILIADALNNLGNPEIARDHRDLDIADGYKNSMRFLVFQILVAFRRPRSIASIQWTVIRFLELIRVNLEGAYSAKDCNQVPCEYECVRGLIDETVASLVDNGLLNSLEGGFYWIDHHTHEFAYRILTNPFWEHGLSEQTNDLAIKGSQDFSLQRLKQDILQCLCTSSWNSTIARFYYVHAFQRTGDVTGLFEYIYHRISSLRYLRLARILVRRAVDMRGNQSKGPLQRATGNEDNTKLESALEKIVDVLRYSLTEEIETSGFPKTTKHMEKRAESFRKPWSCQLESLSDLEQLRDWIDKSRARLFRTLINVLDREQHTILRVASADTWLNWIETLFQKLHDIYSFRKEDSPEWRKYSEESGETETEAELANHAAHFRILLLDLKSKLLREKGDYKGCLTARLMFLSALIEGGIASDRETNADLNTIPSILDNFTSLRKSGDFDASQFLAEKKISELAYATYSDLAGCWRRASNQDPNEKYISCFPGNRTNDKSAFEASKGSLVEWAHENLSNLVQIKSVEEQNIFELRIRAERIRTQVDEWDLWAPTDRPECFAMAMNDISKLESKVYGATFRSESDFHSILAEIFSLRGWILTLNGSIEEGVYCLREALNGLREEDSTQQFQISVIRRRLANCFIRDASRRLESEQSIPSQSDCDFAKSRLREASQELAVVERILKRGRRNVRAWKHLYRAKAQLEIERLLLLLQRIQSECLEQQESERFVGFVQDRLIAGLEAIRGGLDCTFLENTSIVGSVPSETPQLEELFQHQIESEIEILISKWIRLFVAGRFVLSTYIGQSPEESERKTRDCDFETETEVLDRNRESKANQTVQRQQRYRKLNRNFKARYRDQWISLNNSVGIDRLAWCWSNNDIDTTDIRGKRWKGLIDQLVMHCADTIHDEGPLRSGNSSSMRSDALEAMNVVLSKKCAESNQAHLQLNESISLVTLLQRRLLSMKLDNSKS